MAVDTQFLDSILSGGLSGSLQPSDTSEPRSYLKQSGLKDIVALTPEERAADKATNENPAVKNELLKEIERAKDPVAKNALIQELKRQGGELPTTPTVDPIRTSAPATQQTKARPVQEDTRFKDYHLDNNPAFGGTAAKADSGGLSFSKEIGAAIDSYQANMWAIPAAMGSEYALNAMLENKASAEKSWQESGAPQSFDEMEFGKNFGAYFAHMALQSAPYMLEFMATGFGVGSAAKAALANTAKGIAEKATAEAAKIGATKEAAKKAGEAAAAQYMGKVYTASGVAGSYPSAVGDILSNQHEQAGEFNLPAAAALGVPYAALNAAGAEGMAVRAAARGLPKSAITKEGAAGFAARAALTGAEAGVMEGSTETGQEVMNQLGRMAVDPNASLTDQRALDAYKESFIAGALLGGVPGAAVGGFRKQADELQALASQHAAQQAAVEPKQNSPLSNAANAAQAADPITEALKPISERFADRTLYDQIRSHPNLGPDAMTQILSAYRVATNSNMDPMARQAAVDRLGEFFRLFDNQPNFTAGKADAPGVPAVVGNQSSAVGPADPRVGAIDGEASRVAQSQQQGVLAKPVQALATDERARKAAEAEYDAAYQDLVKADQLGVGDQELMQRQLAVRNAEIRLQEINEAIEANRIKETAEKRDSLLGRVLASNPENPNRAFDRALRLEGFRDATFTEEEKAKIARFNELRSIQEDGVSAAPNEAGDFGIKEKRPSASAGRYQHIADMLSSGWQLANKHQLTGPNGETYNLKGAGEAQFVRNKLNQKAGNGNQSPRGGAQGGTDQGDFGVGGAGANGPLPQGGGNGSGQANALPNTGATAGTIQSAEVAGNGGASNGDVAASRQWLSEEDELNAWFGNSLVVGPDGRPLTVYHTTYKVMDEAISEFDRNHLTKIDPATGRRRKSPRLDGVGVWFSNNPAKTDAYGEGAQYPAHLKITRPVIYRTFDDLLNDWNNFHAKGFADPKLADLHNKQNEFFGDADGFVANLKQRGFDGLIILPHERVASGEDMGSTEFKDQTAYIVFDGSQIRSVFDRRQGEFVAAESEQVAQEAQETNDAQAEQASAAAPETEGLAAQDGNNPAITKPENARRNIIANGGVVEETQAINNVEYPELPGITFFTRQTPEGKFNVVDERSGYAVFIGAPSEEEAINNFRTRVVELGIDNVRARLESQKAIDAPKQETDDERAARIKATKPADRDPKDVNWYNNRGRVNPEESAKPKTEEIDLRGFTDGMPKIKGGKAKTVLKKQVSNNGVFRSRKEIVEEAIDGGGRVDHRTDGRRLVKNNGDFISESDLGSTALDYAEFLLKNKPTLSQQKTDPAAEPVVNHEIDALTVDVVQNPHHKSEKLININGDLVGVVSRARQQGTSDWGWRGTVSGELHFTEDKAIQVEIEAAKEKYKQRIRTVSLLKTDTAAEPAAQQATAITAENDIEKLANDFRTYPTQVLSAVINNGQAPMLYKAAGVRSADAFSGLPIADQAEAYAKFVQDGGAKAKGLPADYNEWVRSQESDAESRRMQSERTIRQSNGKPFKTEAGAKQAIERFGLAETHEVNPVDGGFELQKLTPAAQLERRRKAEGKESYTEAQDAVMRQLGIEANSDGEYDLTEAQWANVERRVDARLRGGVATESHTQPEAAAPAYADDAELQDALSHLGDVLGDVFGAKLNITGKQYGASDLLPAMSKVIELLIKKGFKSFRESVGAATNAMRGNANTKGFVDQITPRQWKAAYNSVAEFHEGTDSEEDVAKYSAEQIQKIIALPEKIKEAEQATNHDATPGQKEAGNYAKGKFAWHGLNIAVETAKGEDRTDKETNGDKWRVTMPATYGYVLGSEGADGDHVDVFMGDKPESQRVYVVNQTKPGSTEFDEHKIMLGYESEGAAIGDYLLSFSDTFGASVLGSVSGPYAIDDFKHMLESNRFSRAKPISDRLAYVNPRVEEKQVGQQPPGVKTNGTKEKAAAERLAQLLDKMDQVRIDRNTPEGSAKGIVRSVIDELRKERSVGNIPGLLDTAAQRLFRQYSAFSEVASEVAESLRAADKYAETVANIKAKREERAIPTLDKITVTRSAQLDGKAVEYDQQADEALQEIDGQMNLAKRLLECLAA